MCLKVVREIGAHPALDELTIKDFAEEILEEIKDNFIYGEKEKHEKKLNQQYKFE